MLTPQGSLKVGVKKKGNRDDDKSQVSTGASKENECAFLYESESVS